MGVYLSRFKHSLAIDRAGAVKKTHVNLVNTYRNPPVDVREGVALHMMSFERAPGYVDWRHDSREQNCERANGQAY